MCITTIIAITMNIILPVCFAGVSHGAMLSWPAEVLPQVRKFKSPPEMRVLKHDLDVMGITNEYKVTMKKISVPADRSLVQLRLAGSWHTDLDRKC